MNYDEFIHISGESYNDISEETYHVEIEPAYMALPGTIVKDKAAFCKWWSKNREICTFISLKQTEFYGVSRQLSQASKALQEMDAKLGDANKTIEKATETNRTLGKNITLLRLRAAFTPDKLSAEMRLYYFDEYENAKATAKELGII